jgi:hypothetical protein
MQDEKEKPSFGSLGAQPSNSLLLGFVDPTV